MSTCLEYEFEAATTIRVYDALVFYKAFGRFPTDKEISLIVKHGIHMVVDVLQLINK